MQRIVTLVFFLFFVKNFQLILVLRPLFPILIPTLNQKRSFPLKISSVNMGKSAGHWLHLLKKFLIENSIFCIIQFIMCNAEE